MVNGQVVAVNPDGTFRIPNITARDCFGADGPGTQRDSIGDDFVRVIGLSTRGGTETPDRSGSAGSPPAPDHGVSRWRGWSGINPSPTP